MKTIWNGCKAACRICFALIFALCPWYFAAGQFYFNLESSTTSGNHNLIAGTVASPVVDVYGMVATFSGDFSGVDEETIGVDWSGSWLMANNGSGAHSWNIFSSEDGATLTFWRTDEALQSGYGKVLELVGSGVVGELILGDLNKRKTPIQLSSIQFLGRHDQLLVYPQPCSSELRCTFDSGTLPESWTLVSSFGETVASVQGNDHLDCSSLPNGLYWVSAFHGGRYVAKPVTVLHE